MVRIYTAPEYWGADTTVEEAERAANALATVLRVAASRLGIDEEVEVLDRNWSAASELPETVLDRITGVVWHDDDIQAAAYTESPIDTMAVLRRYNEHCRKMGGVGYPQFD